MESGVTNKWVSSLQDVMDFLENQRLLKLLNYWSGKCAGRLVPSRQDIDPSEIGALLSCIYLVDFEEPDVFRYRVAGTEIAETFGYANLKGKTLADILNRDALDLVTNRWLKVTRERSILCMKGHIYNSMNRNAFGERLLLPLADNADGEVTGILGMTISALGKSQDAVERCNADMILFPIEKAH